LSRGGDGVAGAGARAPGSRRLSAAPAPPRRPVGVEGRVAARHLSPPGSGRAPASPSRCVRCPDAGGEPQGAGRCRGSRVWSRSLVATELATLAGGCFWCLEAVFQQLRGVTKVVSGYTGGSVPNPSYQAVCTGATGHAEVTQVTFDPAVIAYRDLLDVFFTIHDPTTLNRQGNDEGTQYRSAIFYHSPDQRAEAERAIKELEAENVWDDPIVTEVVPLEQFYPAEGYHQDYYARNASQPYCRAVIAPKVAKLRTKYFEKLKV